MFLVIHGVGTDGRPSVNHVFGKGSPTWDCTLARHFNVSKNAWRLPMWFPRSPTVTKLVQLCWYKFSLSPIYSQFLLILKGILLSEKGAMKKSLV